MVLYWLIGSGCEDLIFSDVLLFFVFKQKAAYEVRISDWSSDVCSSDLAYLRGADLRAFKADFWMILLGAQKEVPGLIKALKAGRVNGSTSSGECACLVCTLANVRRVDIDTLDQDSRRPATQWFLLIRERSEERRVGREGVRTGR